MPAIALAWGANLVTPANGDPSLIEALNSPRFETREAATEKAKLSPKITLEQLADWYTQTDSAEAQRRLRDAIRHRWVEAQAKAWVDALAQTDTETNTPVEQANAAAPPAGDAEAPAPMQIRIEGAAIIAIDAEINGERVQFRGHPNDLPAELRNADVIRQLQVVNAPARPARPDAAEPGGILGVILANPSSPSVLTLPQTNQTNTNPSRTVRGPRSNMPVAAGFTIPGLPANAFLRPGDRLLTVADQPVSSRAQVQNLVKNTKPGNPIAVVIERDGEPLTRIIRLGDGRVTSRIATGESLHPSLVPEWLDYLAALQTTKTPQTAQPGPRRLTVTE